MYVFEKVAHSSVLYNCIYMCKWPWMWWTLQEPVKFLDNCFDYKWGCRDNAVARVLCCGPGFDSRTRHHMWFEFVVGSRPCPKVFLWVLRFSSLHKNQHSKFQFDLELRATGLSVLLLVLPSLNKVNLYIYYIFKFSLLNSVCCTSFQIQ